MSTSFVSTSKEPRLLLALLLSGIFFFFLLACKADAQEDSDSVPLGDVARSLRTKKAAPSEVVIDNDNFTEVVAEAEKKKASGSTMVFSLEPGGKDFQVSSPDVSCSFSFSAKTSSLLADPASLNELPRSELAKLDGPATIDGDSLQVSVHNGSSWDLREVVIGLTILRVNKHIPGRARRRRRRIGARSVRRNATSCCRSLLLSPLNCPLASVPSPP